MTRRTLFQAFAAIAPARWFKKPAPAMQFYTLPAPASDISTALGFNLPENRTILMQLLAEDPRFFYDRMDPLLKIDG